MQYSQDCQAVRSLAEMFAERQNFRRTTVRRKAGRKPVLPFSDHCMPTIWFLCNAEYDEYGNTGCRGFKRGLQN